MDTDSTPKSVFKSPFFWFITLLPIVIAAIQVVVISYSHYGDLVGNTCFDEWKCWGLFFDRYSVVLFLLTSSLFLAFAGFAAFNVQGSHDKLKVIWSMSEEFVRKIGERLLWVAGGIIFGCWITLTNAVKDSTDFWAAFGAMLAGLGTLALFLFAWIKADEWIQQIKFKKTTDIIMDEIRLLLENSALLEEIYKKAIDEEKFKNINDTDKLEEELISIHGKASKLFNKTHVNIQILIHCHKSLLGSDSIIEDLKESQKKLEDISPLDNVKPSIKKETVDISILKEICMKAKPDAENFAASSKNISLKIISHLSE